MIKTADLEEKGLQLIRDENGLKLTDGELELRGDFTKLLPRLKYNNLTHEILIKAAKIKGSERECTLIDATAGLGEDSLLFAAAGFRVIMFERDPVIAALLKDAMVRADSCRSLRRSWCGWSLSRQTAFQRCGDWQKDWSLMSIGKIRQIQLL